MSNYLFSEVKVTRDVSQYPYVIFASAKFKVATSNGLGEDIITRNVTDGQTDRRWTDFGTKFIYSIFQWLLGIDLYELDINK